MNNKTALSPQTGQGEPGQVAPRPVEPELETDIGTRPSGEPAAEAVTQAALGGDAPDAEDPVPGSPLLRRPDGSPRGRRAVAALAERQTKRAAALEGARGTGEPIRRLPKPRNQLALVDGATGQVGAKARRTAVQVAAALEDADPQPAPLVQAASPLARRSVEPDSDDYAPPKPKGRPPLRRKGASVEASGPVAQPAGPAMVRKRHYGVLLSSFIFIWVPVALAGWYLWTHAVDQFESRVGFAVRTEEAVNPYDFIGALGGGSGAANDMDVLNEFIRSQQLVKKLDAELDLRRKFGLPDGDPLLSLPDQVTIEDLVDFWRRMVIINYDSSTGLMDLQVFAFTPEDAQLIAKAVLSESGLLVNEMSAVAREDTTRFTKEALEQARIRMSDARAAITEFRIRNQIVDPTADIAAQMSVLATLNQQLAAAQVDLDTLLTGSVTVADPRVQTANRRIDAIEGRIALERTKLGVGEDGDMSGFATLFGDYERLKVDVTFAEGTYLAALNAYDGAETEAQRKSRYLAAFVQPTLAEASTAPQRPLLLALVFALGFFTWSILVLIYYALRDRR